MTCFTVTIPDEAAVMVKRTSYNEKFCNNQIIYLNFIK